MENKSPIAGNFDIYCILLLRLFIFECVIAFALACKRAAILGHSEGYFRRNVPYRLEIDSHDIRLDIPFLKVLNECRNHNESGIMFSSKAGSL